MAEDGAALEAAFFGIGEGRRREEGKPQVVVAVGEVLGRTVDVGATEIFVVVDVGVQGVGFRLPDLVGLALEALGAPEYAVVVGRVLEEPLVEGGTGDDVHPGTGESVGQPVDCRSEWAWRLPVASFGAYD